MSATIIESAITGKLDPSLLVKWLNNDSLEDVSEDCELLCCSRSEFVTHFLYYLRSQTDSILQTNSSALQVLQHSGTPEKLLTSRKHQRSISDPTFEADRSTDKPSVKEKQRSHESPNRDKKRAPRKVKTKLFSDEKSRESVSSEDSKLNASFDRIAISSTPMKNGLKPSEYPNLSIASPVTLHSKNYERCDTPRVSHRHSRSQEKTCLGDYLVSAQKSSKKKRTSKNASDDSEIKMDLDLNNSDIFPEIGARKSSSLRSDKRRIKPTNIDRSKKSLSLNSFNSECFQQPSPLALEDNAAFKLQKLQPKELSNSFDAERNILKQERHKLMEKFNILNTESPKQSVMPQIKINVKESLDKNLNFVNADPTKVMYKEKIEILIEIYDALLKNNLILSMNTEIYFLIMILLSKQYEEDFNSSESKLKDNNLKNYLLKIIHNSTYFAVKSLWHQKSVLELILEKTSLKLLGENKKIRSFYPELAKFLLNSYGLKCEAEGNTERRSVSEPRSSNGVICFNQETDNVENFPSIMSFQNFKKQRDMFYEILRWYNESQPTVSRTTLRARAKSLLSIATTSANHAHLASLLVSHMLAQCQPQGECGQNQESRLSKLQRRLTRPAAAQPTPTDFQPHELFYKDLLECAENDSFRTHARDVLASQLCALDASALADERTTKASTDIAKDYLMACRQLRALARLLALLTALPYAPAGDRAPPRERVLDNYVAIRNYSQPTIDLKGILTEAYQNGRLTITIPWLVQYLSLLDYASLRIDYYQQLLKMIFQIYANKLTVNENTLKKNTVIFLKTVLGSLFSLPHFPQELFYEKNYSVASGKLKLNDSLSVASEANQAIDNLELIDEVVLFELCPSLKEVNSLLMTCKVGQEQKGMGSFRHITPVSLCLNTEEKMRNKERELQARLEEEFLKSQPASTRRALDVVSERCLAAAARQLAKERANARISAYSSAKEFMNNAGPSIDQATLLQSMETAYTDQLQKLREQALQSAIASTRSRVTAALAALLPHAPTQAPLVAIACTNVTSRLHKWMNTHWNTTAVLSTDIESEMRSLLALGEAACSKPNTPASSASNATEPISAAGAIIDLKEQICLILEGAPTPLLSSALASSLASCSPRNPVCRAPTQRALIQLSLDLCLAVVSKRPKDISEPFLNQLHAIWDTCCPDRRRRYPDPEDLLPARRPDLSPELRIIEDERAPTPVSDEENQEVNQRASKPQKVIIAPLTPTQEKQKPLPSPLPKHNPKNVSNLRITIGVATSVPIKSPITPNDATVIDESGLLEYFDRVLCPRNIVLLSRGEDPKTTWEAMAVVLVFLLKNDYLSEDSLTEQCLAVYRQDWPQPTLEHLSQCMRAVSSAWRSSLGKFTLFLDFLAEYCGDMDLEPVYDQ